MYFQKSMVILFLLVLKAAPSFTQVDFRNFQLDSFKMPDIDRRALIFSGGLLGNYSNVNLSLAVFENESSIFSQNLSMFYSRFRNTREMQSSSSYTLMNRLSFSKGDRDLINVNGNILILNNDEVLFNPSILAGKTQRKYKSSKFLLSEYSFIGQYQYDKREAYSVIPPPDFHDVVNRDSEIRVSVGLGFGRGRLEPISAVTLSMFLLQDAQELGVDLYRLTAEDIYGFAARMEEVRNQRIFDNRRLRIQQLRSLYDFMISKDWVLRDDPGFFTVLTDNWLYSSFISRSTGKRWTYAISPYFDYSNSVSETDLSEPSRRWESDYGAELQIRFEKFKPLHLYKNVNRTHILSVGGHVEGEKFGNNDFEDFSFLLTRFDNTFGYSWYLNSRTNISAYIFGDFRYYHLLSKKELIVDEDQFTFNTGLRGQADYFISYQTRLVLDARVLYGHNTGGEALVIFPNLFGSSGKSSGFNARLNASIVVSIF